MRLLLCALAGFLASSALTAQDPLTMDEVLLLLRLGVPSASIHRALETRGGPEAIVEEDLARARRLRPGPELERWLESRSKTVQNLERLARSYQVHSVSEAGIDLLIERTWEVESTPLDQGSFLTIRPQIRSAGPWFSTPTILCWIARSTAFPVEARAELADRVSRLFLRRLRSYGLRVKESHVERGRLGAEEVTHLRVLGEEPVRRYAGTIGLRTRVLPGGTVVSLAFAAGSGDLPRTREVFEEIARSISLRPRLTARGEGPEAARGR